MSHLTLTIPEALAILVLASLLMWAPVFGLAYARRPFGGSARNYLIAYGSTCALTVAAFVLLTVIENASR